MKNLSAEMARCGVTNSDIQVALDCTGKTVWNKLNDVSEFSVGEAIRIAGFHKKQHSPAGYAPAGEKFFCINCI